MAAREMIYDFSKVNFDQVIDDIEGIRKHNPQRHQMEQLTAIVHVDEEEHVCIGYKDVTDQAFWVSGHMPGMPLMPGVVMLEAAAQLCSYYVQRYDLLGAAMVGFGGLEDVRFRDPVLPGDRLLLGCKLTKMRRGRMLVSRFQGMVGDKHVVEGVIKGIPIPVEALSKLNSQ